MTDVGKIQAGKEIIKEYIDAGNCKGLKEFLKRGYTASADDWSVLEYAEKTGTDAIRHLLLGESLIRRSDSYGHGTIADMERLISMGADVNYQGPYGHTPLGQSLQMSENLPKAELLLLHGADVNIKNGINLIGRAPISGNSPIVRLLLDYGADVHARNDAALCRAADSPWGEEAVQILLEYGANPHANENMPIRAASADGSLNTVALLLAYGADPYATGQGKRNSIDIARGGKTGPVISLLKAHKPLEELITAYETPKSDISLRILIYRTAALAAELGCNETLIPDFTRLCMKENATDKEARRIPSYLALDPLQYIAFSRKAERGQDYRLKELNATMMEQLINETDGIRDMVNEYGDVKILPQLLVDAHFTEKDLAKINKHDINRIEARIMALAAMELLGGKSLEDIISMSREWHHDNAVPEAMRPLLTLADPGWAPLIDEIVCPSGQDSGTLTVRALHTRRMLQEESRVLQHCVGKSGNYAASCLRGWRHILSIQEDGVSVATIEVSYDKKNHTLQMHQLRGYRNAEPPSHVREAWAWFADKVRQGEIIINTRQWGSLMPKSAALPHILQKIGYMPTQEKIDACLEHYHDHLLIKQNTFSLRKQPSGGFLGATLVNKGHSWVHTVSVGNTRENDADYRNTDCMREKSA